MQAARPADLAITRTPPQGLALKQLLARLIWVGIAPLLLLALYLVVQHVRALQSEREQSARNLAVNFVSTLDQVLMARIGALRMLALSDGIDNPAQRGALLQEAQRFKQSFGNDVILADANLQMLFNTRATVQTQLPKLPTPQGRSAVASALQSGQASVGDVVFGPVVKKPLVAMAVPVLRQNRAQYLLLTTLEVDYFQSYLQRTALPPGWRLRILDSTGALIAQRTQDGDAQAAADDAPLRFAMASTASPWSVQVEIPRSVFQAPLHAAGLALVAALVAATLTSLLGGRLASNRLTQAVQSLVAPLPGQARPLAVREIEDVRALLAQAAQARDAALTELRDSQQRLQLFVTHAPAAIAMFDRDMRCLAVSQRWLNEYALTGVDMLGRVQQNRYPELARRWAAASGQSKGGAIVRVEEDRLLLPDGTERWLCWEARPWYATDGAVGGIAVFSEDITARKQADMDLKASEFRWKFAVEGSGAGLWDWDLDAGTVYLSRTWKAMIGHAEDEVGNSLDEWQSRLHPEDRAAALQAVQRCLQGETTLYTSEHRFRCKDGSYRWMDDRGMVVSRGPDGAPRRMIGMHSDITQRKQAETDLRIAAAAFDSQEGMMVTDAHGVILKVNRAFTAITGYTAEEIVGQTPQILHSGRHPPDFYQAMWDTVNRTGSWQGEVWDRRKTGEEYQKWLIISAVKSELGEVTHYVGTHYDISEHKKAEETIRELAFYDTLTHLPNRTLLQDRLKQAMMASKRSGSYGALLFIDLDHFKTLNDTLGHDTGDLLLQQVARRLIDCVRQGDTVARLGGDEFVVVLEDLSSSADEAAKQSELVGAKILQALNQKYPLASQDYRGSASIGATLFSGTTASMDELLKQADLAMYRSKDSGRNALRYFDPKMQSVVMLRAALENDLRDAIQEQQFLLHYQPQIEGTRIVGVEALVRWQHPTRGMVPPIEFIPLAEDCGLILPLGRWVLDTACRQLAQWAAHADLGGISVSVNVSVQQFRQHDFVQQVEQALASAGANPRQLKLELTESLLVDDVHDIVEKMGALQARGVGFALDDFGTGYSSLAYLKLLPLNQLKIDQSFVRDVLEDPNDAAIARTIIGLAHSLGFGVMAEGVETAAQRDFLQQAGCPAYQGYFFSKPLAADALAAYAARMRPGVQPAAA